MSRLNTERELILTPKRVLYAVSKLKEIGIDSIIVRDNKKIEFYRRKNKQVVLFAYSGWWSGKGIGSGRGIDSLIKILLADKKEVDNG